MKRLDFISGSRSKTWFLGRGKTEIQTQSFYEGQFLTRLGKVSLTAAILIILAGLVLLFSSKAHAQIPCPTNLWQGLIAESTKGDLEEYRCIASVVRNRLNKGMWHGLIALKRKNLEAFVSREVKHNPKLETLAKRAVQEDQDYANGATHYEHTGAYPVPSWAKKMKVVKVLFKDTKHEITFYREV